MTLNLPANPPESALVDASEWALGFSAKLLALRVDPPVILAKSNLKGSCALIYADRDIPVSNKLPALKKGWQYIVLDSGSIPTVITDPLAEGFQWVLIQGN